MASASFPASSQLWCAATPRTNGWDKLAEKGARERVERRNHRASYTWSDLVTYSDCCNGPAPLVLDPTFSHPCQPAPNSPPATSAGAVRNGCLELSPLSSKPIVIAVQKESLRFRGSGSWLLPLHLLRHHHQGFCWRGPAQCPAPPQFTKV